MNKQWPFKIGDEVIVRYRVVIVHEHDFPWTLTIETLRSNPGTDGFPSVATLCSNLVEPKPRTDWVQVALWATLLAWLVWSSWRS